MRNYMKADLFRLARRIPQIIVTLLLYAAFALTVLTMTEIARAMTDPSLAALGMGMEISESFVFDAAIGAIPFFTAFVGLIAMIFVFSDDFKARTAQIAVGAGVSRSCIIFSKLIETAILLLVHAAAFGGITFLMNGLLGGSMNGAQQAELIRMLVMNMVVSNMAYLSLVAILLFTTQSMILAILTFLALSFHLVSGVIGITEHIGALESLQLSRFTLSRFIEQTGANLNGGVFDVKPVMGVILYMVFGITLTTVLYRKKELEL